MVQHVNIQGKDCHEPKQILESNTGDVGKVITPSSTASGRGVLRRLQASEIEGLGDLGSCVAVLNADGQAPKTLPALNTEAEQETVELNSLFTTQGLNATGGTSNVVFDVTGQYIIRFAIETTSATDSTYTIQFKANQQATPTVIATDVPTNGLFLMETLQRIDAGSATQIVAYSSTNASVQINVKRSISITKVS